MHLESEAPEQPGPWPILFVGEVQGGGFPLLYRDPGKQLTLRGGWRPPAAGAFLSRGQESRTVFRFGSGAAFSS
jgi:hypothetical protein